jgi:N-acyl-D-aspartate/D-glutamate deacylase
MTRMTRRRHAIRFTFATLLPAFAMFVAGTETLGAQQFDVLIRGGTVIDGSGSAGRLADVGIRGETIVSVGDLSGARATRVIDADGLYVVPGFIDTHSHATWGLARDELRTAHALLAQGVTTILANPDGGGPIDLAAQRADLMDPGVAVNVAQFVPHGSVRREVLGMQAREATPDELERMRVIVRRGMEEGAFGLSSGLYYSPGSYAPTGEVAELAKIAGEFGGAYQSHIRDESDYTIGVVAAVDEVIEIARAAGIPGVVTHIKALGPRVWGSSREIVEHIEAARAEGLEIFADQYPYEASGTGIVGALVPRWALAGGDESFATRLADAGERARLVADMWENLDRRGGADRLVFQGGDNGGKSLEEVADARGMDPVETAITLLQEGGPTGLTSFNMDDDDIHRFMRQPWTMTSSDGILNALDEGHPHPRDFGSFPRKIRKYVVEKRALSLEQAIHSMSGLPARVFKLPGRGVLEPGAFADVVVFDLEAFRDVATYDDPNHLSEGVEFLFVNGVIAIDAGRFTDALAGEVLRKTR